MTMRWHVPLVAAAATVGAVLSGCTSTTTGSPVASPDVPVSTTTTTSRTPTTTTPPPSRRVTHRPIKPTDARQIIDDVVQFWRTRGVRLQISTGERNSLSCNNVRVNPPAAYCVLEDRVVYVPLSVEMKDDPKIMKAFQAILAHEVGHAVQDWADRLDGKEGSELYRDTGVKRAELSADCLSGVYMATQDEAEKIDWDNAARNEAYRFGLGLPPNDDFQCLDAYSK